MGGPIVFTDLWRIRDGRLQEFKDAAREFVEFVSKNEPQLIAYNVYIDEENRQSTVIQIHPNSESIEFHMKVAGPQFGKFMELYEPGGRIQVHGRPADHVVEQMRQMAQQAGVSVTLMDLHAGFARFQTG
jgi:quinol monooxygenase YgiN